MKSATYEEERDLALGPYCHVQCGLAGIKNKVNNQWDKGMGSFFFVYMSMSQVSWIFQLFITISSMLGEGIDFSSALFGISFGLGTMGLVLSVVSVTLALDRSYLELSFFPFSIKFPINETD